MNSILDRIRERVKDPAKATSMSRFRDVRHPIFPPTTPAAVAAAEARIGFRLPPLLRAIYTEIANGGIGPGYGLVGVAGSPYHGGWAHTDPDKDDPDLADTYLDAISFEDYWPPHLIPICDWGCLHSSAIDCSDPSFPVVFDALDHVFRLHSPSFDAWIEDWFADVDLWERGFVGKRIFFEGRANADHPTLD